VELHQIRYFLAVAETLNFTRAAEQFPLPEEVRMHYLERGVDVGARHGSPVTMLPVPATYVVRPDGRIFSAFGDVDFTRRQEPDEIVAAVRGAAGA
jgi:hypothetical protein